MKAIIIEDEINSQEALKNMVTNFCKGVEIVAIADTVNKGAAAINKYQPDFIFLDIELPEQNGFELFNIFTEPQFEVIFTTAYNQYALSALKISAIDYLLKPIDLHELRNAISLVKEKRSYKRDQKHLTLLRDNLNNVFKKIALPTSTGFQFLALEEILRCEAKGNYTCFHLTNGKQVLVSKTLKIYDDILEEFNFFRVSRGHLINLSYIAKYGRQKSPIITLEDGTELSLSTGRRDDFLKKIETFTT